MKCGLLSTINRNITGFGGQLITTPACRLHIVLVRGNTSILLNC